MFQFGLYTPLPEGRWSLIMTVATAVDQVPQELIDEAASHTRFGQTIKYGKLADVTFVDPPT